MDEETKRVLFQLAASHSKLAEAEYHRNPTFNDTHFAHKAEEVLIAFLVSKGLLDELLEYIKNENKESAHETA